MTRSRCSFISVVSAASAAAARWMDGCSVVQDLSTRERRQQPNNQLDIQLQQRRTGAIWGISCRVWFSSVHPPPGSRGGGRQGCANGKLMEKQNNNNNNNNNSSSSNGNIKLGGAGRKEGGDTGTGRRMGAAVTLES